MPNEELSKLFEQDIYDLACMYQRGMGDKLLGVQHMLCAFASNNDVNQEMLGGLSCSNPAETFALTCINHARWRGERPDQESYQLSLVEFEDTGYSVELINVMRDASGRLLPEKVRLGFGIQVCDFLISATSVAPHWFNRPREIFDCCTKYLADCRNPPEKLTQRCPVCSSILIKKISAKHWRIPEQTWSPVCDDYYECQHCGRIESPESMSMEDARRSIAASQGIADSRGN